MRFTSILWLVLTLPTFSVAQNIVRPIGRVAPDENSASASTNRPPGGPLHFTLSPSPIAPPGAAGSADLRPGEVSLHLTQLGPGRYELEAVREPGALRQRLGAITIVDPTLSPDRQATDNKKEASAAPEQVRVDTDVQIKLGPAISLTKVSRIALLDSGGNIILSGDAAR